uniref:DUF4283 domain-containing protein n=1 Tax=Setaria viridis TaxID=4556 RepID=A0A4U6U3B6_SETVI|nr:hypothetical protein SEVIR_6G087900v2 [Setaria viridis]
MRDYEIGDPALRPDEDRLHVPTSFELDRELRDWEGCTMVTWAMRVPPDTTARHLEEALIADFRLHPGDVDVTRHHPEAFLLRFQNQCSCEEVCVQPWWSLTGNLGVALFYRVRLLLDGVPRHAWQSELVERIVSHTCSLQCIGTNLLHTSDTRGIELWAWTADPSKIPKEQRRLPRYWGVRDGEQAPMAAFEPFHHPPPPRVQEHRNEWEEEDRRDRARRDCIDDHAAYYNIFDANGRDDEDDNDRDPRHQCGHTRHHDSYGPHHRQDAVRRDRSRSPHRQNRSIGSHKRANHVLCQRLGYIEDDYTLVEEAIREFVATFQGPMPQDIIKAMTTLFQLDDKDLCKATGALI